MPPLPPNKHKHLSLAIAIALGLVSLLLYFAPFGVRNYLSLRQKLTLANSELEEITKKNQELTDEINLLKTDAHYVETIARQKLGMLKKNEVIFEVPEKKSKRE